MVEKCKNSLVVYVSKNSWWDARKARKVLLPFEISKLPFYSCVLVNAAFPIWRRYSFPRKLLYNDRFLIVTPLRILPFQRFRWVRFFNQNIQLLQILYHLKAWKYKKNKIYFLLSEPEHIYMAKRIRFIGLKCFYDWTERWDDYAIAQGIQVQNKNVTYNEIVSNVDGVIAVSRELFREALTKKVSVLYLPNAVSDSFIKKINEAGSSCSKYLKISSPIVAYAGSSHPAWIQWDYLIEAALENPSVNFCMIGDFKDRKNYPDNIHFLGAIPYEELPLVLKCADAFMMLYDPKMTSGGDPTKLYEYLATGCPIISTKHPRCIEMGKYVATVETSSEFAIKVKIALKENNFSAQKERKKEAARHLWKIRAKQLVEWIEATFTK